MEQRKKKTLPEDTYLACISYFLCRDFYPALSTTASICDPGVLSNVNDTPSPQLKSSEASSCEGKHRRTDLVKALQLNAFPSVDAFQSVYTSEDNASFEDILERINEAKRARWRRFFGTDKPLLAIGSSSLSKYDFLLEDKTRVMEKRLLLTGPSTSDVDRSGREINVSAVRIIPHYQQSSISSNEAATREGASKKDVDLMPPTPSIVPGSGTRLATDELADGTPLMTWGRLASTPLRIQRPSFLSASGRDGKSPAIRHILGSLTPKRNSDSTSDRSPSASDLDGIFKRPRTPRTRSGGSSMRHTATPSTPLNDGDGSK